MWYQKLNSPLQKITDETLTHFSINLYIKRDDLIHPEISGNKWRKLKYNIEAAKKRNLSAILTFGGTYSNHIAATASAGKDFGIKSIGIIRGEETFPLNPTLSLAKQCGMELHYMDRTTYREKETEKVVNQLKEKFDDFWLVPEGGYNKKGALGCEEIIDEIDINFDYICTACGTATTLSGIINAIDKNQTALGFSALKGGEFLHENITKLTNKKNYQLITDYHFGGYAKYKPELIDFIHRFKTTHNIQLDPIYTGKMMFGIYDLIKQNYFQKNTTIIAVHTGGLQGIAGFNERHNTNL